MKESVSEHPLNPVFHYTKLSKVLVRWFKGVFIPGGSFLFHWPLLFSMVGLAWMIWAPENKRFSRLLVLTRLRGARNHPVGSRDLPDLHWSHAELCRIYYGAGGIAFGITPSRGRYRLSRGSLDHVSLNHKVTLVPDGREQDRDPVASFDLTFKDSHQIL